MQKKLLVSVASIISIITATTTLAWTFDGSEEERLLNEEVKRLMDELKIDSLEALRKIARRNQELLRKAEEARRAEELDTLIKFYKRKGACLHGSVVAIQLGPSDRPRRSKLKGLLWLGSIACFLPFVVVPNLRGTLSACLRMRRSEPNKHCRIRIVHMPLPPTSIPALFPMTFGLARSFQMHVLA